MLYIGHFHHICNQQAEDATSRSYGEFNLIVEAEDNEAAIEMFRQRIVNSRGSSGMFDGECTIYFTQLLEFDRFPRKDAMLLNYKSYAGDPGKPFIGCITPTEATDHCRVHDWVDKAPEIDGQGEHHFLSFKADA
jgi:hypothetical protein